LRPSCDGFPAGLDTLLLIQRLMCLSTCARQVGRSIQGIIGIYGWCFSRTRDPERFTRDPERFTGQGLIEHWAYLAQTS
jgi:hypothetical protein